MQISSKHARNAIKLAWCNSRGKKTLHLQEKKKKQKTVRQEAETGQSPIDIDPLRQVSKRYKNISHYTKTYKEKKRAAKSCYSEIQSLSIEK